MGVVDRVFEVDEVARHRPAPLRGALGHDSAGEQDQVGLPASPNASIFVCAAQFGELDVLDIVEVHGDVADVAEEPRPPTVGRNPRTRNTNTGRK